MATRKDDVQLPTGAWIILGLLLDGGPARSGYDLQAQAARSVANFWPVTKAHVYAALPRLEAAGFVRSEAIVQLGSPDKKLHAATQNGRAAFSAWLNDTDLGNPTLRHPMLVRIFFGAALSKDALNDQLNIFESETRKVRASYAGLLDAIVQRGNGGVAVWRQLAILHGVRRLDADLEWIAEVRAAQKRKPKSGT